MRRQAIIFHAVFFAVYPVLHLFAYNVEEVPVRHLFWPLVAALSTAGAIWAAAGLVLRSGQRGALVSSAVVTPLMLFQPIRGLLTDISPALGEPVALTGIGLLFGGLVLMGAARMKDETLPGATRALNVFAVTAVTVALAPALSYYAWGRDSRPDISHDVPARYGAEEWSCPPGYCPDIFYLVLDGYGRADALAAAYQIDNRPFIDGLRAKGFFVARRSTANYSSTVPSLQSALNMDYRYAPQDGTSWFGIETNLSAQLLRVAGYDYVLMPSGLPVTSSSPIADLVVDSSGTQSEFGAAVIERSIYGSLVRSGRAKMATPNGAGVFRAVGDGIVQTLDGARQWQRHIEGTFEALGNLPSGERPKFVFAHIVAPHPPYVFDRTGQLPRDTRMTDLSDLEDRNVWDSPNFAGQLTYVNRLLTDLIDRLQSSPNPPVIVIHGDHGTYRFGEAGSREAPSDRLVAERMSILLAVSAPPGVNAQLYDEITPVNLNRAIFRGLFDAPLPRLPDRNYWSTVSPPRDVTSAARAAVFPKAELGTER